MFVAPRKDVQRHIVRAAPGRELVLGRAVDVNLPFPPSKRFEIIDAVARDPGQAISAMHMPGNAAAQWSIAIVEHDLRNGAEHEFAHGPKMGGEGKYDRRDARTQDVGNPALGGRETENTIGGRNKPPRKADALALIAVEQGVR